MLQTLRLPAVPVLPSSPCSSPLSYNLSTSSRRRQHYTYGANAREEQSTFGLRSRHSRLSSASSPVAAS